MYLVFFVDLFENINKWQTTLYFLVRTKFILELFERCSRSFWQRFDFVPLFNKIGKVYTL